jgi:hypothetical protein
MLNLYKLIYSELTNSKVIMIWLGAKLKDISTKISDSQRVAPELAASTRPRILLKVHVFKSHLKPTEWKLCGRVQYSVPS